MRAQKEAFPMRKEGQEAFFVRFGASFEKGVIRGCTGKTIPVGSVQRGRKDEEAICVFGSRMLF